ncbi:MAG: hypothetical protein J1F35_05080 [Erysipelotrichales bacterium]|nr:hypothetical protein [Erysipelotrichales bacterium]
MDKYRFRSTVYLVFLLVSLFINGVLLYMLIDVTNNTSSDNANSDIETKTDVDDKEYLVSEAMKVYEDAYRVFNEENNNFFIDNYEGKNQKCTLINFNMIDNYFTAKAIAELSKNLTLNNGAYYDCHNYLKEELSYGLFGTIHQRARDLKYISSVEDTLIVSGQLEYDGTVNNDVYPLYMIFKYENNKWLIDFFE